MPSIYLGVSRSKSTLSEIQLRKIIIEKIIEGRTHNLSQRDIQKLVEATDCYSPSDIKNLLNFSSNICVDKKLSFTHLSKKPVSKLLCFNSDCNKWHIAAPSDEDENIISKESLMKQVPTFNDKDICNPPVSLPDILSSKSVVSKTVSPSDLQDYVDFAWKEFKIKINEPMASRGKSQKAKDKEKSVIVKNEHVHTHVHK